MDNLELVKSNIPQTVKIEMTPSAEGQVYFRFENIEDLFDSDYKIDDKIKP